MLYGIKDASNLTVLSKVTSKPILYADYCNTTDLNFKADSVYAMLKGVKSIRWDRNKEGEFKTEMEVFDLKWISLLLGTSFATGITQINKREVLSVSNAQATLSATPKTGTLVVFKLDPTDGLTHLSEQTVGTPASQTDKYSISGLNLTFNSTTFPDNNGKIVAYYIIDSASTSQTLNVKVTDYPTNYSIIGDTMVRGQNGVDQFVQFTLPNVKPKMDMAISFNTDSPTKLSISWDVFADASGNMMTFTII